MAAKQQFTAKALFAGASSPVAVAASTLGGSPVWDHRMNRLSWVDTPSGMLHQFDATTNTVASFCWNRTASNAAFGPVPPDSTQEEELLSFAIPCADDADVYICGCSRGIFLWAPANRIKTHGDEATSQVAPPGPASSSSAVVLQRLPCITPQDRRVRINDACVDPQGRLYYGTMDLQEKMPIGAVCCFDPSAPVGRARTATDDASPPTLPIPLPLCGLFTVSHGIDWSPGFDAMYLVDRPARSVFRVAYDTICGVGRTASDAAEVANVSRPSSRDVVFTINDDDRSLGGLCVDEAGCIWVAVWGAERVLRIDPGTGSILAEVDVPGASCVTNVCFGGPKLSRLFVTTAARALPGSTADARLAGQVFVADVGVCGLPFQPFPVPSVMRASALVSKL